MAETSATASIKYRAFLSYSHRDKAWGKWLHRALENYRIEKDLVGRATPAGLVPKMLRPIFRDREDFAAGHSLTEQTLAALEASQFLIVICSPNAAQSKYVNEEIRRFKALGGGNRIVPVIVDGEPGDSARECFPPALQFKLGDDGQLTDEREEPIAADARQQADGKEIATRKVVAGLLGLSLDEIVRRAERAKQRRNRFWAALAGVFLMLAVAASGSAVYAYQKLLESEERLDQAIEIAYGFVAEATSLSDRIGVPVDVRLALLQRAEAALDALMARGADTPTLRYRRALMLLSFADGYRSLGRSEDRLNHAYNAVEILKKLVGQASANLSWQHDLALAHVRFAEALRDSYYYDDARANLLQSVAIGKRLTAAARDNRDWLLELAISHKLLGELRKGDEALSQYNASLAILEPLAAANPGTPSIERELSVCLFYVAQTMTELGKSEEAAQASRRAALDRFQRLAAAEPENAKRQFDYVDALKVLSDKLVAAGRAEEAMADMRTALAIATRVAGSDVHNAEWQDKLAAQYERLADVLRDQKRFEEAAKNRRVALDIYKRLVAAVPGNSQWQVALAQTYQSMATALKAQGKLEEAIKSERNAVMIFERQGTSGYLASTYHLIGDLLEQSGRLDEAVGQYRKALEIDELLNQKRHSEGLWLREITTFDNTIGDLLQRQGKNEEALASYRSAIAVRERMTDSERDNKSWQHDLAIAHQKAAALLLAQGALSESLADYQASIAVMTRLADAQPSEPYWTYQLMVLATDAASVADGLAKQNKLDDAVASYRALLPPIERAASAAPDNWAYQRMLANFYEIIARTLERQQKSGEALASYRLDLAVRKRAAGANPDNADVQHELSGAWDLVGRLELAHGDPERALASLQASLEIEQRLAAADQSGEALHRVATQHFWIGEALLKLQRRADAILSYRASGEICERLAAAAPDILQRQWELIRVSWKLAAYGDDAVRRWTLIIGMLRKLKTDNKLPTAEAKLLPQAEAILARIQRTQPNSPERDR